MSLEQQPLILIAAAAPLRRSLQRALRQGGYRLEFLPENPQDAPLPDGARLCIVEHAQGRGPLLQALQAAQLPFVVLAQNNRQVNRALQDGAADCLTLPLNGNLLRRRVEVLLEQAETSMEQLVYCDNMPAMLCAITADGTVQYVSRRLLAETGHSAAELVDRSVTYMMQAESAGQFREQLAALASDESVLISQPLLYFRKDGSMMYVLAEIGATTRIGGRDLRLMTLVDITLEKHVEDSLRSSENEMRSILAAITDTVMVLDEKGRCVKVASTGAGLLYSPSSTELLGKTLHEVMPDTQAELFLSHIRQALETQQPSRLEHDMMLDGQIRWFSITVYPMQGTRQVVFAIRNITESKTSEQALRESEQRYRNLFEYANDAILLIDMHSRRVIDANKKACRQLGYNRDEMLQKSIEEIELPDDEESHQTTVEELETNRHLIFQHRYRRKDGSDFPVETSNRVIQDGGRRVVLSFARDVSTRRAMQKAERKQRMLAEALAANAAALSQTLQLDEVLQLILDNITRVINCDAANIMLIEDGRAVVHRHSGYDRVGMDMEVVRELKFVISELPTLRHMIEHQSTLLIADTHGSPMWDPRPHWEWIRSFIGAPITLEGTVIGFLSLDSTVKNHFSIEEAERLQAFANQAAIAIRNARLFDQIQRYAGELEQRVAQRTAALSEANEVLRQEIAERQRVEVRLQSEHNLLRTLIDNLPDMIYVKDREGHYMLANRPLAQYYGYDDPEAIRGKTEANLLNNEELAEYYATQEARIISSGQPQTDYEDLLSRPGTDELLWVLTTRVPLRDAQGQVTGLIGVNRDITRLKLAEQELQDERNLLRTIVDNLPLDIYVKDLSSRFVLINRQAALNHHRRNIKTIIGHTDFDILSMETAARVYDQEQALMRLGRPPLSYSESFIDENGSHRWLIIKKVPLRDSEGNVTGLVGLNHDITELKQAEEQLQQILSSARCLLWHAIVEEGPDGLLYWNLQIHGTEAALSFLPLELKPGERFEVAWYEARPEEDKIRTGALSEKAIRGSAPGYSQEFRCIMPDGTIYWLNEDVEIKELTPGRWRLVGVCTDITERKKAAARLQNAYDEMEQRVETRTAELLQANNILKQEIAERKRIEEELRSSRGELQAKTESLTIINSIADTIYRSLDFQTVIDRALDAIIGYAQVQMATLFLMAEDQQSLRLVAARDATGGNRLQEIRIGLDESLSSIAVASKNIIVVNRAEGGLNVIVDDSSLRHKITSVVIVPLLYQEQVLGTIELLYQHAHELTAQERETLLSIGKTISLAMINAQYVAQIEAEMAERKRAEEAERQRGTELETLRRASLTLTSTLELQPILQIIVDYALKIIEAESAQIYIYENDTLSFGAGYWGSMFHPQPAANPRPEGITYSVARSGLPVIVPDVSKHSVFKSESWKGAVASLPLRTGDTVHAVLNVMYSEAHHFNENELRVLGLLADQAAIALQNAGYIKRIETEISDRKRAQEAEREQRILAEALRDAAAAVNQTLELDEVFGLILDAVARALPPHRTASIMLVSDEQVVQVVHLREWEGHRWRPHEVPEDLRLDTLPNLNQMIRTGQPMAIPHTQQDPHWVKTPYSLWTMSYVGAPILSEGRVIGLINLRSEIEGIFTEEHAERLQAFANQAGIAIQNARLLQEIRRYAAELEERVVERTAQLNHERAQLRAILDSMRDGVIYYDSIGRPQYTNHSLIDLTGFDTGEWLRTTIDFFCESEDPADREEWQRRLARTLEQQRFWQSELRLKRRDEAAFDASLTITRVRNIEGEQIGMVAVVRDISKDKQLEEQKARFITSASHELRTPIANIKTRLYLIKRQPDKTTEHMEVIGTVIDWMQRLVENLFDLARFERGVITVDLQPLVLQDMVRDVIHIQQAEAEERDITLDYDFPPEAVHLQADRYRLTQVMTNLISNALHHTPAGGRIRVEVAEGAAAENAARPGAFIRVRDTGSGIEAQHLPYLFQPFFRGKEDNKGAGLGLSIAREIVERHEGQIMVESEVGSGSCFIVWLPLQPGRQEA